VAREKDFGAYEPPLPHHAFVLTYIRRVSFWDGSVLSGLAGYGTGILDSNPTRCTDRRVYSVFVLSCVGWGLNPIQGVQPTLHEQIKQNKLRGLSPLANYNDRATNDCR
jgi:hypothetical protein